MTALVKDRVLDIIYTHLADKHICLLTFKSPHTVDIPLEQEGIASIYAGQLNVVGIDVRHRVVRRWKRS